MPITVYQTAPDGVYIGEVPAFEDPMQVGEYLIPQGAYAIQPPTTNEDQVAVWEVDSWSIYLKRDFYQQPITNIDVNIERTRRIAEGVVVDVEGYGDVALEGRLEDQVNLIGLYNKASLMVAAGETTTETKFRDRDNVDHMLTPFQIIDMWTKGSAFVSSVIQASWELKDMDPIPLDYTDDKYWP